MKLSERAREGIVGVPVEEARSLEDQMGPARIDTVRLGKNHLPQLEGQMDFFVFCCFACCCACCAIKSAGRVIKQLRLVFLLLVNRVVKRSADVEWEVNLVGGHFALSVRFGFVCSVVRKYWRLFDGKVFQFYGGAAREPPLEAGDFRKGVAPARC